MLHGAATRPALHPGTLGYPTGTFSSKVGIMQQALLAIRHSGLPHTLGTNWLRQKREKYIEQRACSIPGRSGAASSRFILTADGYKPRGCHPTRPVMLAVLVTHQVFPILLVANSAVARLCKTQLHAVVLSVISARFLLVTVLW
jgi:hypothetical protein